MTSSVPGCCIFCGFEIPFRSILIAPLSSGQRWRVACPHCKNRNYMHFAADYFICLCALLLAFILVSHAASGLDATSGKSTKPLAFCAVLATYIPLRGVLNYAYLRVGRFRKRWI